MSEEPTPEPAGDASARRAFRRRLYAFASISVLMLGVAGAYVVSVTLQKGASAAAEGGSRAPDASAASSDLTAIRGAPYLLFRNLEVEPEESFGRVGAASLGESVARALTPLRCVRVHYAAGRGICLEMEDEGARKAVLRTFDADFVPRWSMPLEGLPSRARVSPDGKLGAVTVFVTGHSYSDGAMSTRTTLLDLEQPRVLVEDIEAFEVTRDGSPFRSADFNFWGVTFGPDSTRFHATLASGSATWLVEADLGNKTMRTVRDNVECPSRSPDGTRIAFKKRMDGPGSWRLHVLELATGQERMLGEDRPIDDQVEWLDDGHLLYKHGPNVYVLPIAGGAARPYVSRASSPAVVRRTR